MKNLTEQLVQGRKYLGAEVNFNVGDDQHKGTVVGISYDNDSECVVWNIHLEGHTKPYFIQQNYMLGTGVFDKDGCPIKEAKFVG